MSRTPPADDDRRAEQIATEYAVGAATIDFSDMGAYIDVPRTAVGKKY